MKLVFFTLAPLIFLFVLAEGGLRFYLWFYGSSPQSLYKDVYGLSLIEPHPYLVYALRPGARGVTVPATINSQGYRGAEFQPKKAPGTFRIICMGESTTFDENVSGDDQTYPQQLENYLRAKLPDKKIEVINAGVPGWTSAESLINLQMRLLDLEPDLIIPYHANNDIWPRIYQGFRGDYSHYRKTWVFEPMPSWGEWFLDHLALADLLWGYVQSKRGMLHYEYYVINRKNFDYDKGVAAYRESGSAAFKRNLQQIIRVARANDIAVLLPTFAYRSKPEWVAEKVGEEFMMFLRGLDEHNAVIRELGQSEDVVFVDFEKKMPNATVYYHDEVHNTDDGARKKAEILGEAILAAGLIKSDDKE